MDRRPKTLDGRPSSVNGWYSAFDEDQHIVLVVEITCVKRRSFIYLGETLRDSHLRFRSDARPTTSTPDRTDAPYSKESNLRDTTPDTG